MILSGKRDPDVGRSVRDRFLKGIPGFDKLVSTLNKLFDHTAERGKYAYIIGLDGRPVYVDGRHKTLNYLLQSCEKITCSLAVTQAMEELDRKGFDWQPLIMYHDFLVVNKLRELLERLVTDVSHTSQSAAKLISSTTTRIK